MGPLARRFAMLVLSVSVVAGVVEPAPAAGMRRAVVGPWHYFHGQDTDGAIKWVDGQHTATFDTNPPTRERPIVQSTFSCAEPNYVFTPYSAFWVGPYSGRMKGNLELSLFLTSTFPSSAVGVTVIADPRHVPDPLFVSNSLPQTHFWRVQSEKVIGRSGIVITGLGSQPRQFSLVFPVDGTVQKSLLIQFFERFPTCGLQVGGVQVHYDSVATPSGFRLVTYPKRPKKGR